MPRTLYLGKIPVCYRDLNEGFLGNPEPVRGGAVERDYDADPVEMRDAPSFDVLSDADAIAAQQEQEKNESSLFHMYMRQEPARQWLLDQNGHGYCWAYSTGDAMMFDRMKQNLIADGAPPVIINPHATAAIIKRGRDEGGWCGLSMKWARENGYALVGNGPGEWPLHSLNLKYDTNLLRDAMKKHMAEESWYDLGRREYDQVLTKKQLCTLVAQNLPCPADWMRHSHSMDLVWTAYIDGRLHPVVHNSWKNWGYKGFGVLYDQWPNNAVCLRASTPSVT
mgnify:CR=1 FL=1|jgi:hypothetical protein